jgi:hypothetical protein
LRLAVAIEEGLFFIVMNRYFLQFINNKDRRILIDLNDIRFIEEGGEHSKGYCKIFFYSDITISEWIKEDYDSVIEKIQNFFINLNS